MERKLAPASEIKFDGSDGMTLSGYGAVFGNIDAHGDVIAPGAFKSFLERAEASGRVPAMLVQHGMDAMGGLPVGVWTELREDSKGLYVTGRLAETTLGRDIYTLLKMVPRPAFEGLSIGFRAVEWQARRSPDEPRRTLKQIDLFEISLVTMPANDQARISDVKTADTIETKREFERFLRDAGFTRSKACELASRGWPDDAPGEQGIDGAVADLLRRMKP